MKMILALVRKSFIGTNGLRAGWRTLIFAVSVWYMPNIFYWFGMNFLGYQPGNGFAPLDILVYAATVTASSLFVGFVLTKLEKHDFAWFGFPMESDSLRTFGMGLLWGAGAVSLLMLLAISTGYGAIHGVALQRGELLKYGLLWVLGMILVGFAEELFYRGYALRALADGIGFWPATIVTSLLFGAVHYIFKPMETFIDILNIVALGLFMCFTIWRSGTLWFAIGFHAAFDFFALSLYGSPNTGNDGLPLDKHILDTQISGPAWLTGGPQGLEASWFLIPLVIFMTWLFHRYYPAQRYLQR